MAELTNKLHIKDSSGTVTECTCYTTAEEAYSTLYEGSNSWEIKNNNTVCYLGLKPSSITSYTEYDTPLKVKKDGTEYVVQSQVAVGTYTVTITGWLFDRQWAWYYVNGVDYDFSGVKVYDGVQITNTYEVQHGTVFGVELKMASGWTRGSLSCSNNNYTIINGILYATITEDTTITVGLPTKGTFTVTITQTENQTITVTHTPSSSEYGEPSAPLPDGGTDGGTDTSTTHTSTFTAKAEDTWTATIVADTGYTAGTLSPGTSGTITDNVEITASAASQIFNTLTLDSLEDHGYWQLNGVNKEPGSYQIAYGTSVTVECFANDGYTKPSELTMQTEED